eukprot:CAMPEP_0197823370 /NCGR_PEP_ID=MMETSP1437-20131217/709_1 /TAXON_ID=49252 ORGANISM="Eucampia antarctica, Strain CCMP1452" /NCGR_SAMPLE_ID=MMETSP1437 /ASSEMBLY_ACC=CAM_ASM_001096 /LENGTH=158 /DNA_ID=CAMNT_0043422503 /DNA_START=109 /DNA_END=585 /DNA_ORIENTATION=+
MMNLWNNAISLCIACMIAGNVSSFTTGNRVSHQRVSSSSSSSSPSQLNMGKGSGNKGFFGNFMEELDAFVDDATSRRLGNGAAFYGKRKSSFYGDDDKDKKLDKNAADPTEDYQGPSKAGYFQWMQDEDGQMRPVTRMKKKNIERNPKFWDRAYKDDE